MISLSIPRPIGVRDILRLPRIRRPRTASDVPATQCRPERPEARVSSALILAPGMVAR